MQRSRRSFLKQAAGIASMLLGGTGCAAGAVGIATLVGVVMPAAPPSTPLNSGPVWQPSPTIEFVEGVPTTIPVRHFVVNPDNDSLVIALKSGVLSPGITWNPRNSTIAYDGRPLGAKADAPVVVSGISFTADDGKN